MLNNRNLGILIIELMISHLPKASSKQNKAETFSDDKIWGAKDEVELAMVA